MKQNNTMYKLARATALRMGPRTLTIGNRGYQLAGYYLTHEELLTLHKKEGFNTHSPNAPWLRRIADWKDFGKLTDVCGTYVFTDLSTNYRAMLEKYAASNGIKEVYV